jgi:hypothetical protein
VQHVSFTGSPCCPICAQDNGRDVVMSERMARVSDKPEGRDARKEER